MIFCPGEQSTLDGCVSFEGTGLHSGKMCRLEIEGAPEGSGIVFRKDGVSIQACPDNVVDTSRGTTIGRDGRRLICIEHVMAALAGVGIDNAICIVDGPELPAMDGSALPYAEALAAQGVIRQGKERRQYNVKSVGCVASGGTALLASPAGRFRAGYLLRYDHPMIGISTKSFEGDSPEFLREIAPARTFGLASEAEQLRSRGLALGASTENALVVFDHGVEPEMRFRDEFVRHKLLDMLGDLALTGGAISAAVFGIATGHTANVEMARRVMKE